MRVLILGVSLFMLSFGWQSGVASAETTEWMSYRQHRALFKKNKRAGKYPTSVRCRNSPKAKVTVRPQIQVSWKKDSSKKDWAVIFHRGGNTVYPYNLLQKKTAGKGWRITKKDSFRGGSANYLYRCYIWLRSN